MKQRTGLMIMTIVIASVTWAAMAFAATTHLPSIGNVKSPRRIAIDTQGSLYVTGSDGLLLCTADGVCKNAIVKDGLSAVAVDQSGMIYVGSEEKKAVLVYNRDFTFSHNLGSGTVEFDRPNDIAIDGAGRIYVVDSLKNTVSVFEPTGEPAFTFGGYGNGNGTFTFPTAIAINDTAAEIYVTDLQRQADNASGARISVFDKNGTFKRAIGKSGQAMGQITRPIGVAVDLKTGKLYVADAFQNAVLIVDQTTGLFTTALYDATAGRTLATPQGVAIGKNGIVYIASSNGGSIELYGLDGYVTMDATPGSLAFTATQFGAAPASQTLTIANTGSGTVNWTAGTDQSWLTLSSPAGSAGPAGSGALEAGVDIVGLAPGAYTATITLTSDSGLIDAIPVSLTISPAPSISLSGELLAFTAAKNSTVPSQAVTISIANASALSWTAVSDANWLGIAPSAGNTTTAAAVSVSTAGLATGSYTGHITVSAPGAIGSGSQITVNLTIQPGTRIAVSTNVAGAAFTLSGPANYSGSGQNWSVEDVLSGSYSITYDAVKGYEKPSSQTLTLGATGEIVFTGTYASDAVLPVLTLSTLVDGSYTNNATLNLAGTATDNLTLSGVTVNGVDVTVNADGSFSQAVQLALGANLVTTVATDSAGNTATDSRTIVLDQSAPVITVSGPSDNSVVNASNQTIAGSVDKASTVSVEVLGGNAAPATMTGNAFSLPVALAYGQNTVQVTATDLAGNFGTVKRTVILDNINPTLAVTYPAQDLTVNQPTITLQGTVADLTGTTVTVTLDGTNYMPSVANGVFQQQLTFAAEKTYAVMVTASDAAGNTTTVQRNAIYAITPTGVSPASLSFGSQLVNTASEAQTVVVRNSGAAMAISKISIGGDDSKHFVQTNDCPASLPSGASCTVTVTFKPTTVKATMSADLSVKGEAKDTSWSVPLSGSVASAVSSVSLSPATLSFGNQAIKTSSAAQTVTVTSTGTASMQIKDIRISGDKKEQFAQTNDCPAELAANASCTISVIFKPTQTRSAMSANLMVNGVDTSTSRSITLTGNGTRK